MDRAITDLKLVGAISLLKFKVNYRNYPGWHLIADEGGRKFLADLLDLMASSEWSSRKVIEVTDPTRFGRRVPNWDSERQWIVPARMELIFRKEGADWLIEGSQGAVHIQFSTTAMTKFQKAIAKNSGGENDFAIGEGNDALLWFW